VRQDAKRQPESLEGQASAKAEAFQKTLNNRRFYAIYASSNRGCCSRQFGEVYGQPQFVVLSLTEAAAARARNLIEAAGRPVAGLRVGIKKGGCAGMTYTMDLADEVGAADEVIEDQGVKILIEPKDLMFLLGTKLDFETTTLQSSFTFQNPNQTGSCGCGESVFDRSGRRGPGIIILAACFYLARFYSPLASKA